jgi:AcrR family transcriptional regulator
MRLTHADVGTQVMTASGKSRSRKAPEPQTAASAPAPDRRKRARRMAPDMRQAQILDAAARIVLEEGQASCTPDAVAAVCGISKPLVYKYFASREALLGALLQREFDYVRGRDLNLIPADATAEQAHRVHVRRYLEYLKERGGLMRALISDAGVIEQVRDTTRTHHRAITNFWTEKTMESYGLPKELARMGMIMTMIALDGAEGAIRRGKVDLDEAADFWTTFILAGWEATGRKFSEK